MKTVMEGVTRAFNSAFDLRQGSISLDTSPKDIKEWDSMGHVTLASSLEQEFNITFDVDELMEMENVREIVRIIESKLQKS